MISKQKPARRPATSAKPDLLPQLTVRIRDDARLGRWVITVSNPHELPARRVSRFISCPAVSSTSSLSGPRKKPGDRRHRLPGSRKDRLQPRPAGERKAASIHPLVKGMNCVLKVY
jgi:hypothetical protein